MKKILASLLTVYTLTNGQAPPIPDVAVAVAAAPGTTQGTGTGTAATPAGQSITPQPTTPAPVTTTAPIIISDPFTPGNVPPVVPPVNPPGPPLNVPPVTPPEPPIAPPVVPAVIPAATTPAPVTPAPVTPAPVTPAPTTPAPTTASPTTAAPTFNPYCPMPGELVQTHGIQSGNMMSSNQGCISPFEKATAFNGILQCSTFACCQCAEIQCGDPFGLACDELVISQSGAVGNQNINVLGDMASAFGGNSFAGIGGAMNNGAQIRCNGLEACKASKIYGKYVGQISCSGDMGCAGANIRLEDPGNELQVQCNGMMSCMNTNLEIIITASTQIIELGTIEFNGQQAAQGMTIKIENQGINPILLQNLECMNPTACPNLRIDIIGQIYIENCDLQHMNIQTAGPSLLAACQAGNALQGGGIGLPQQQPGFPQQFPPVQQPGFPQQQFPQVPPQTPVTNPGPFNPVAPSPQTPVVPAPPAQLPPITGQQPGLPINPGFGGMAVIDPQQLTCELGNCRNRAITLTPRQNFQLKCPQAMQCDGLQLTLNMGDAMAFAGFLPRIDSLTFSAPTNGATINIVGYAEINDIRCEVANACNRLTVNGPGIDIWSLNMDCQQPGSCIGCTINGQDCNQLAMMQGNTGGFGGIGYYGAPQYNQPSIPQQPAVPQQPAQQYPQYYPQWI